MPGGLTTPLNIPSRMFTRQQNAQWFPQWLPADLRDSDVDGKQAAVCQSERRDLWFLQLLTEQAGLVAACSCDISDGKTEEK